MTSKEAGTKTQIANTKAQLAKGVQADKLVREDATRAVESKQKADKKKADSIVAFDKAMADERNSKNDALERTKKQEASAIQRAVEKKNKAAQVEASADEHRAYLRKQQFLRARAHHSAIIKTMDKFIQAKGAMAKKHKLGDIFAVKAMEKKNEDQMNAAENAHKHAIKNAE